MRIGRLFCVLVLMLAASLAQQPAANTKAPAQQEKAATPLSATAASASQGLTVGGVLTMV
jgi:hypothetical protein